ncbi:MAG: DUF5063 domain-containing protein [Muribaculaceae bacterium]|nr:DUF5063 domain-containing protein [Muribaculaceae bacterium]MDE6008968.1 DUF5063 domain-containing protein [Muribaculaceae bacterium]MDE6792358.1 DUF5063 domain-containing protein [Muribaculaceae bacterium]
MTEELNINQRLLHLTSLAVEYCSVCENAREMEREEFINRMLDLLPRIYWEFFDISGEELFSLEEFPEFSEYVDEDYYESIRRYIEMLLGPDDTFLETFEEDMKYSDTPIAASIAESLADIFQPLFNFASIVKDTEGERIVDAFLECKGEFENYWSQTLCNVLRALNNVKYRGVE